MKTGVSALASLLLAVVAAQVAAASPETTSTAATTSAATTTAGTAAAQAEFTPVAATLLSVRCAAAGAAAIVLPGRAPLVVGPVPSSLGASTYSAGAPVVTFGSAAVTGSPCSPGSVSVQSLSLFDGAVTADSVSATGGQGSISNLRVDGQPVSLGAGESTAVGGWALLIAGDAVGTTLSAPLSLHLLEPRGELPAGTVVLIGFGAKAAPAAQPKPPAKHAAASAPAPTGSTPTGTTTAAAPEVAPPTSRVAPQHAKRKAHHKRKKKSRPLKVTPPLGLTHYVFPVAHGAAFGDTYGGPRSDVSDGWHHGDDLFGPLGTPVVAVASGTLSLVGWNSIGGWRVWLEDAAGNQFYYAHLAAYSRWILRHRHVKAGQVIGFLGRTGDAFTTPPHVHFEIHPHQLLRLGYDGAVDPTSYLQTWRVAWPKTKDLPQPALLRAPRGVPAEEAATVWRQLLTKRHIRILSSHADAVPSTPRLPQSGHAPRDLGAVFAQAAAPSRAAPLAAHPADAGGPQTAALAGGAAGGMAALAALGAFVVRRRRAAAPSLPHEPLPHEPSPSPPRASLAAPLRQAGPSGSGLILLAGLGTLATVVLRRAGRRG